MSVSGISGQTGQIGQGFEKGEGMLRNANEVQCGIHRRREVCGFARKDEVFANGSACIASAILKMVPHPYAPHGLRLHPLALLPHPQMQSGLTTTLGYWVMVSLTASTHVPTATSAFSGQQITTDARAAMKCWRCTTKLGTGLQWARS